MTVLPRLVRHNDISMLAKVLVVGFAGVLLTACAPASSDNPGARRSVPTDIAVERMADTTMAEPPCHWVEVTSVQGHALPAGVAATSGRIEQKLCGAPEGDTTGMGGPVEWRVVPTGVGPSR